MAVNVVVRGKWKPVKLEPSLFLQKDMNHLICIEELTDYNIEDRKTTQVFSENIDSELSLYPLSHPLFVL